MFQAEQRLKQAQSIKKFKHLNRISNGSILRLYVDLYHTDYMMAIDGRARIFLDCTYTEVCSCNNTENNNINAQSKPSHLKNQIPVPDHSGISRLISPHTIQFAPKCVDGKLFLAPLTLT